MAVHLCGMKPYVLLAVIWLFMPAVCFVVNVLRIRRFRREVKRR